MRSFRLCIAAVAALAGLSACTRGAKISGVLTDAPAREVSVVLLDINKYQPLDTIKTDAHGRFSCTVPIKKGQPEFVYLFHGGTRIASLLLEKGDKVSVTADTLGSYSVSGSAETDRLMEVERDEAEFNDRFATLGARLADLDPNGEQAAQIRRSMVQAYVEYYRSRVSFIMKNPHSLTVIPVLYQSVGEGLPVFRQATDAIHFRNACDSLMTVYPESRYVKALNQEATRRQNLMELGTRIQNAPQTGYMDLEVPDVNGKKVKLSEVDGKLVMIWFWTSESAEQKIFNLDVLLPIYEEYHSRGLEIYAVSLDVDKTAWATVLRNQKLPWINVCDGRGAASLAANLYNLSSVPTAFFIKDGSILPSPEVTDAPTLRKYIASALK